MSSSICIAALLALLSTLPLRLSAVPLGRAFTYQGRLNDGGAPANGAYDLTFTLHDSAGGPNVINAPLTNSATAVSNGLFTVTLDFGPGAFTGDARWLEIAVRTNGSSGDFVTLTPRQPLTATPYARYANSAGSATLAYSVSDGSITSASIAVGAVGAAQLASNSVTVTAGTGLNGGGTVALGAATTLNNAGVLSVTGNADITAAPTVGNVVLGTTAASANTANTIVKRDGSGNFSAGTVTAGSFIGFGANLTGVVPADNSVTSAKIADGTIVNADISTAAAVADSKLATITTSGKVANSATTAASANTASTIVARDASGNFSAGTVTLTGNLNLPATTTNSGVIYSGGDTYLHTYGNGSFYAGPRAGNLSTTGGYNTGVGRSALEQNTSGFANTANGYQALYGNLNAGNNTANGYQALYANTSGSANTANGANALSANITGAGNTANGCTALYTNSTGAYNTANGYASLYRNSTGSQNTADGAYALYAYNNGFNNIGLGYEAGVSLLSGSNNIFIGNIGGYYDNGIIRLGTQGTQTNTFIAGIYGTAVSGSSVQVDSAGRLGVAPSSQRFKQDIQDMGDASDALLSFRPVTFRYRPEIDSQGTAQFGLIAEEVDCLNTNLVVRDAQGQVYTVRYEAVNAMLLNEFLKEHRKVEQLEARLEALERRLNQRNGGSQ